MPATIPLAEIEASIAEHGGHYSGDKVRHYRVAMRFLVHKHSAILTGLSGTGKTQLALKYTRAVRGLSSNSATDPQLFVWPVQPEWTDPSGLTSYYDVLSNRYIVPPFLEAEMLATAYRASHVLVMLHEMDLARAERNLSDVLSAFETGEILPLHSSDVVVVIEISAVDLVGFLKGFSERTTVMWDVYAACEPHLLAAQSMMAQHGLCFGYRVTEEFLRCYAFASKQPGAEAHGVIDVFMVHTVLVRLRGSKRQRPLLTGLVSALENLPKPQAFLARLTSDLDEFGSFLASRYGGQIATLHLRSETVGSTWRVWPEYEVIKPGTVQETGRDLFELNSDGAESANLLIDDLPLEALRVSAAEKALWRWLPGFCAGTVEAELRLTGKSPRCFEVITYPDQRNLTRGDFDAMVREILEDYFALFSLSRCHKSIARRSRKRAPQFTRPEFLRPCIVELEEIVAEIARAPRRLLSATDQVFPSYNSRGAAGPDILRSVPSGRILKEKCAWGPLPAPHKGFCRTTSECVDT